MLFILKVLIVKLDAMLASRTLIWTCRQAVYLNFEWDKCYPKRVIQVGGSGLSKQIIHIKKFIQKSFFFFFFPTCGPNWTQVCSHE